MRYVIGVDFGSLSGRALLVETDSGREIADEAMDYPHAVMSETLPNGEVLPPDYALQDPKDYLDVLHTTIPRLLRKTGVPARDVVGIGIDFTACTLLPVDEDLVPLCFRQEYAGRKHAYVKLWKHHAAQKYADRLNAIARERGEAFLSRYGGKISAEWAIPKIWEVLDEDPELFGAAARFMEAGDYVVSYLVGKESHSAPFAGYKAIWNAESGYPSPDFFAALDERMRDLASTKLSGKQDPVGARAGGLCASAAEAIGLCPGTAVAVANIDAHVAMVAAKACRPGTLMMIMGTSTCHILNGTGEKQVPGMCGVVKDGAVPGLYGFEAGQSCVGDHFAWFVKHCVPADYRKEAEEKGQNLHTYLQEKAALLQPGESGLLALDWWNGNRSVLVDTDLSGMILGMNLLTKPEEIYRALIEATAFGTRIIVETFEQAGVPIDSLIASGGISQKSPFMMQIYADVMNRPLRIAGSAQTPALGSAIFASVAAGEFESAEEASERMGKVKDTVYLPIPAHTAVYDRLYAEYKTLHDYFGRGGNDVMKRLRRLKSASKQTDSTK